MEKHEVNHNGLLPRHIVVRRRDSTASWIVVALPPKPGDVERVLFESTTYRLANKFVNGLRNALRWKHANCAEKRRGDA